MSVIKKAAITLVVMGLYSGQVLAFLPIVYDPYDVFQNTITAKNSIESLINQAKQLELEVQNLRKLSKGHFENTGAILSQLNSITGDGQALSYAIKDIDKNYRKKFPGMQLTNDYNKDYALWSNTTYDTLKNGMQAMSLQGKLFEKENADIHELQNLSETSQGNLSSQQTSHRIALQEISQLQKLRQLLLTQASSQNTFMTYQLQKEQSQQATMHDWIKNSQVAFHQYQGNSGFGINELPNVP